LHLHKGSVFGAHVEGGKFIISRKSFVSFYNFNRIPCYPIWTSNSYSGSKIILYYYLPSLMAEVDIQLGVV